MKQKLHLVQELKKSSNVIMLKVDITNVPSRERLEARLKNRAVIFEDRRFKKPKYKEDYQED